MPEAGTLVTGALGCLGAWTLKALLDDGEEPVGYDLGADDSRLRLVLDDEERARVTLVQGDVTDGAALGRALDEHEITRSSISPRSRCRSAARIPHAEHASTCSGRSSSSRR